MYRTLLVEDDEDLSEITKVNLLHAEFEVDAAFTCAQAQAMLEERAYDLILLDVMLPDKSGDELCRAIRCSCDCPIIFMSCLDDSDTIVQALRSGGDDYMIKPVNFEELIARAEAVIRRFRQVKPSPLRVFRQFTMDTLHHRISRGEQEVPLSSIEYALLDYMTQRPNILLLYQGLYQNVWDSDCLGDFRTVMVHISNLRKKIDPNRTGIIETVRGAGYIFTDI